MHWLYSLLDARGFGPVDFALPHPGGSRPPVTHSCQRDVIRPGDKVPNVRPEAEISETIVAMSQGGLGLVANHQILTEK